MKNTSTILMFTALLSVVTSPAAAETAEERLRRIRASKEPAADTSSKPPLYGSLDPQAGWNRVVPTNFGDQPPFVAPITVVEPTVPQDNREPVKPTTVVETVDASFSTEPKPEPKLVGGPHLDFALMGQQISSHCKYVMETTGLPVCGKIAEGASLVYNNAIAPASAALRDSAVSAATWAYNNPELGRAGNAVYDGAVWSKDNVVVPAGTWAYNNPHISVPAAAAVTGGVVVGLGVGAIANWKMMKMKASHQALVGQLKKDASTNRKLIKRLFWNKQADEGQIRRLGGKLEYANRFNEQLRGQLSQMGSFVLWMLERTVQTQWRQRQLLYFQGQAEQNGGQLRLQQ